MSSLAVPGMRCSPAHTALAPAHSIFQLLQAGGSGCCLPSPWSSWMGIFPPLPKPPSPKMPLEAARHELLALLSTESPNLGICGCLSPSRSFPELTPPSGGETLLGLQCFLPLHLLHSFPQERCFWDWSVSLEIRLELGPRRFIPHLLSQPEVLKCPEILFQAVPQRAKCPARRHPTPSLISISSHEVTSPSLSCTGARSHHQDFVPLQLEFHGCGEG